MVLRMDREGLAWSRRNLRTIAAEMARSAAAHRILRWLPGKMLLACAVILFALWRER